MDEYLADLAQKKALLGSQNKNLRKANEGSDEAFEGEKVIPHADDVEFFPAQSLTKKEREAGKKKQPKEKAIYEIEQRFSSPAVESRRGGAGGRGRGGRGGRGGDAVEKREGGEKVERGGRGSGRGRGGADRGDRRGSGQARGGGRGRGAMRSIVSVSVSITDQNAFPALV